MTNFCSEQSSLSPSPKSPIGSSGLVRFCNNCLDQSSHHFNPTFSFQDRMAPGKRESHSLVPIAVDTKRNDFMCDDTLGRRLKRRKTGNYCFSMDNSNTKSCTCKFIKPSKNNSPGSRCLLIQGDDNNDSDDADDDYVKFCHGLVRGLFADCESFDNASTEPPENSLDHDSDGDDTDENYRMFVEDVTRGLNIDSSWDVYWDRKASSSKKTNAVRSIDNDDDNNVDIDLFNESVENIIGGSRSVNDGVDGGNDDAWAEDPHYKVFLENVRQDGNSYVLELSLTNEMSLIVRYETQDGQRSDPRRDTMQARSDTMKKRKEIPAELEEVLARKRRVSVVESKAKKKSVDPIPCNANGSASKRPCQEAPGLNNSKRQKKLREVQTRGRKASAAEIKVKKQSVDPIACRANEHVSESPRQVAEASNNCKGRHGMKLDMVTPVLKTQRKSRDVPAKERMSSAVQRKLEKQSSSSISCGANGHASKRPSPEALSSTNRKGKCELNLDLVDPSYQFFLNSLESDGGHRVLFMPQRVKKVLNEEEEQSSSDSDMIVMDSDPFAGGDRTPFVSAKQYLSEDVEGKVNAVSSEFRDGLMKNLEKPYDEREYKDLWDEISNRKNVERDLNLRSGTKSIKTQATGKSYLDHYEDLAEMIESAKSNRPEVLNLMRGFFYWLQHQPHDAFRPWSDPSCLKVLQRCKQEIA